MKLPEHKVSLSLEHNTHKGYHEKVEEYLNNLGEDLFDFESEESKQQCIDTDELWTLQWYPETLSTFYAIAAPTLNELLTFASSVTSDKLIDD